MKRLRAWWLVVPALWLVAAVASIWPGSLTHLSDLNLGGRAYNVWPYAVAVYDPADIAAFALRGANASLGRAPGRPDEPEWQSAADLERNLDQPQPPLADTFYFEYPPAALLLFRLEFGSPCDMPASVADGSHLAVRQFLPREDRPDEVRLWSRFHCFAIVHLILMTALSYALILVLRRGCEPGIETRSTWMCVLPAAMFFSLNRFDILPALLTAIAFRTLGRGQFAWSGAALAAGVLFKLYPVLFVPIILRHLGVRDGAKWLAAFAGTLLIGVGLSWAALGWDATVMPVRLQLNRSLETTWTLYGKLLPRELGHMSGVRPVIVLTVALALVLTRPKDLDSVLRRCCVLLVAFVSLAVFWSPQWVVWFLPLVVPLAGRARWIVPVWTVSDLVTYFQFPVLFSILWDPERVEQCREWIEVSVYVRGGLWAVLAAGLVWNEFRPRSRGRCPVPSPSA